MNMQVKDLKTGMLVRFLDGQFALVIEVEGKKLFQHLGGGWDKVETLIHEDFSPKWVEGHEIDKVYAPQHHFVSSQWQSDLISRHNPEAILNNLIYSAQDKKLHQIISSLEEKGFPVFASNGKPITIEELLTKIVRDEKSTERFINFLNGMEL